jgi:hypothetical protein
VLCIASVRLVLFRRTFQSGVDRNRAEAINGGLQRRIRELVLRKNAIRFRIEFYREIDGSSDFD